LASLRNSISCGIVWCDCRRVTSLDQAATYHWFLAANKPSESGYICVSRWDHCQATLAARRDQWLEGSSMTPAALQSAIDLFSDAALEHPYPLYKELRDLGPAAYLTRHDVWFLGRHEQVRKALADWKSFTSAKGIGLNPVINQAWAQALICIDPPAHTKMRMLITDRLGPRELKPIEATIDRRANELVDKLAAAGEFDAVKDLAHDLPVNVIMDLIGWPEEVRPAILQASEGGFDACGPISDRVQNSFAKLGGMMGLIAQVYDSGTLVPGGFGSTIADAARRGEITRDTAIGMLAGYVVAAFDTTISAIASGVWLFANNPGEWDKLRADPNLVTRATNEILRMEAPIQMFSRVATREMNVGGVVIAHDARAIVCYASGNRDERHFDDPDRFDINRRVTDHLSFGAGAHACAGQSLARLEIHAIFKALAHRVWRFELMGKPLLQTYNMTRSFSHLPVRVALAT
jgi:cytochrome P450